MSEQYFTGGGKKYIPKNKLKQMKKKMQKSFEKADELIAQEKLIRAEDEKQADQYLLSSLENLDK